jgi:hypothetical protein
MSSEPRWDLTLTDGERSSHTPTSAVGPKDADTMTSRNRHECSTQFAVRPVSILGMDEETRDVTQVET